MAEVVSGAQNVGESLAASLDDSSKRMLNDIYGQDVSDAMKTVAAAQTTSALVGAVGVGRVATKGGELVADAAGNAAKKLDNVSGKALDDAAEEALRKARGAYGPDGKPLMDFSQLTGDQKRVVGELLGGDTAKGILPNAEQLARAQGTGTNGIDELYKVSSPDVDYVHIEYKFVGDPKKTGASRLKNTDDGLQGSESWMQGSNRLENAVGRETAQDINRAIDAGRIESWVITVRPNGATEVQVLNAAGKPKPVGSSKLLPPSRDGVGP